MMTCEDITEQKRAEEALSKEKEKFRILVEESPLGVSLIGKDGHYKYINPRFVEIFGYTQEDTPTGREWFMKAFPDKNYRNQIISTWINDQKEARIGEKLDCGLLL
jgi:PAS domain S-box-containing protein